jgi:hypothetical protein
MKTMQKFWHLVVLLLAAATVNEILVQWALAVQFGKYTVDAGFGDIWEYYTRFKYLFSTASRLVPYVGLGIILFILSKTKLTDYVLPVFIGGLIGILAIITWGSWMALCSFLTDEPASSTTALTFLFISIYAVPMGVIGAALFAGIYTPIRFASRQSKTQSRPRDVLRG